jgi:hypothetical protein
MYAVKVLVLLASARYLASRTYQVDLSMVEGPKGSQVDDKSRQRSNKTTNDRSSRRWRPRGLR